MTSEVDQSQWVNLHQYLKMHMQLFDLHLCAGLLTSPSDAMNWCDVLSYLIHISVGYLGDAVVTLTKAAMWTDGRYFLQATMQMDDNWTLMKQGN